MSEFQWIQDELLPLIHEWEERLAGMDVSVRLERRNSQKRSIQQIAGHMVDSASNNTHRIIHLQYSPLPCRFPDYANLGNNDRWIALQNYEAEDWSLLVRLWKYSHLHILHVMQQIDSDKLENVWISALEQTISLKAMVDDFPRHFKLHLGEIEKLLTLE